MKKLQCFAGEYMILSIVQGVDSTQYYKGESMNNAEKSNY